MAVEITRLDLSAADLRRDAARSQDAKAARRMSAIALDGHARGDAGAELRHGPAEAAPIGSTATT